MNKDSAPNPAPSGSAIPDPSVMGEEPAKPFSFPIFRNVWMASMASNFGGMIQGVGAAWLMLSLGGTATQVALVQASASLPIMVLSLLAGALADNIDRRKVMLTAQLFMLIISALLAFAAFDGHLTPVLLLVFTFLIGCGTAMNAPSWQALVGDMVPRETLPAAVAMNSMGINIARSAGPALGGAIVAAAGAPVAFAINAVSYIPLLFVLGSWKRPVVKQTLPRESIGAAMFAGVRYVAASPRIQQVITRSALFGLAASGIPSLLPLVAQDLVGGGALTFGILSGTFGIGAVLGAYATARLRARYAAEPIIRVAMALIAVGALIIAFSRVMPVTMAGLFLTGVGWVAALSTFNVSVQMATPRWVVGRSLSIYQMGTFGAMALGAWMSGYIAQHYGIPVAMMTVAAITAASIVLGFLYPIPDEAALNLDPVGRWRAPETQVPVTLRSGPIIVAIHYRVTPDNILAFLGAMKERRRIRMRDGARRWRLLRDVEDALLWVERYQVATWADYIRHNERRTQADIANFEAIKAVHDGSWPPEIHRMLGREPDASAIDTSPPIHDVADPTRMT